MGQLYVIVKFQPDDRVGMVELSCKNTESINNFEVGNEGSDDEILTVVQKPKGNN